MITFSIIVMYVVFVFVVYTMFGIAAFSSLKNKILNAVNLNVANKKMARIITIELNSARKSVSLMIIMLQILSLVYFILALFGIFSIVIDIIILAAVAYGTGYITYNLLMLRKFRTDLVNQINEERA